MSVAEERYRGDQDGDAEKHDLLRGNLCSGCAIYWLWLG